jgi:hypothetical protein
MARLKSDSKLALFTPTGSRKCCPDMRRLSRSTWLASDRMRCELLQRPMPWITMLISLKSRDGEGIPTSQRLAFTIDESCVRKTAPRSKLPTEKTLKTIDDIRHANLKVAADRVGSATMLAEKAGVLAVYLSRLKNHAIETRTGNVKTMGAKVARKLEAAIGEPAGWFDADHTPEAASPRQAVNDNAIPPNEVPTLFF